jgi:phospholipid/cholesterol/gamma-HCH transport system substrate-binding protein
MPAANKARWAQLKVGVMAIFALLILTVLIFLMTGTNPLFRSYSEVFTYLDDSSAMAEGATPVRLNGILIGKVKTIRLSNLPDPNKIIKITLSIDNDYMREVPVDSTVTLSQQNLLGTKFVNISKGRSPQTIQPGAELMSADTPEIQDLVKQGSSTMAGLEIIVKRMDGILGSIEAGNGTIGKLLVDETLYKRFLSIVDEVHKLTVALNSSDSSLGKLIHDDGLYTDLRGTVTRMNSLLDGIDRGEGTAGKLLKDPAAYDDLRAAIADVRKLLAGLNAGEGTAGKLLKSDALHDQVTSTLDQLKGTVEKMNGLLDKINNGNGTISALLNDPALYQHLDATTQEIQGMMKDFRANPKKYLTIYLKLF